jgi:hypothetical protein
VVPRVATPAIGGPATPMRWGMGTAVGAVARTPLQAVAGELSRGGAHQPPSAAKLPGLIGANALLYDDDDIPDDMLAEVDVIAPQQAAPARDMDPGDLSPPRPSGLARDTPYAMDLERADSTDGGPGVGGGGGVGGGNVNVSLLATPSTLASRPVSAIPGGGAHTGPPSAVSSAAAAGASPPIPLQQPARQAAWVAPAARPAAPPTTHRDMASGGRAAAHGRPPPPPGATSGDGAGMHRAVSGSGAGAGVARPTSSGMAPPPQREREMTTTAPGSTAEDVGLRQQLEQLHRELALAKSDAQRAHAECEKVSGAAARPHNRRFHVPRAT